MISMKGGTKSLFTPFQQAAMPPKPFLAQKKPDIGVLILFASKWQLLSQTDHKKAQKNTSFFKWVRLQFPLCSNSMNLRLVISLRAGFHLFLFFESYVQSIAVISSQAIIHSQSDKIHHQIHMANLRFSLLAALLLVAVFSQDEIFYSTSDNVVVTEYGTNSPPGVSTPSQPSSLSKSAQSGSISDANSFMRSNTLGGQAQWVYPKDSTGQMRMATSGRWWQFSTTFNTDCPQNGATITITGYPWQYIVVVLNGVVIGQGWGSVTVSTINCSLCSKNKNCSCLNCGCNTLNVYVWVPCGCPVGICMNVKQDTTGCYDCDRENLAFYNRKTCQCECNSQCKSCNNIAQQWFDYPYCGCMCNKSIQCSKGKWLNKQTCQCECNRVCCPSGMVQDPNSCQCVKGGSGNCWPNCVQTGGTVGTGGAGSIDLSPITVNGNGPCGNVFCPPGFYVDSNCQCKKL